MRLRKREKEKERQDKIGENSLHFKYSRIQKDTEKMRKIKEAEKAEKIKLY